MSKLDQTEALAAGEQNPDALAAYAAEAKGIHAELAALHLGEVNPGRQPLNLFNQLCRIGVLATVEIIGVRENEGETEALITQRSLDEPHWPGLVHVPGSAELATYQVSHFHDFSGVSSYVLNSPKELNGSVRVVDDTLHLLEVRRSDGDRGHELSPIFWAEVAVTDEERLAAARGRFVTRAAVAEIPPHQLHDVHRAQLERAMNAFEAPPLVYPPNSYVLDYQI